MSHGTPCAGITIFCGRFGSGKTEAAICYALTLAGEAPLSDQSPVILIDLDVVTPYFRSRETAEALRLRGIEVIAPAAIGQHLDTPAITPEILGAIEQRERKTVLDVGGDRQGARALGGFSAAIHQHGYVMHFVVNPYRPFTDSFRGVVGSVTEIETSARLQVTSLVSNPNLMTETTAGQIIEGHSRVEEYARLLDLPIAFICLERRWADYFGKNHFSQPALILDRFMLHPWEEQAGGPASVKAEVGS